MTLVFGKTGQVARELHKLRPEAKFLDRKAVDLASPSHAFEVIMDLRPDRVINAAAYTSVDKAESEKDLADCINGISPGEMAKACARLGIPLVHISTEYVFNGTSATPYCPDDPVSPLGAYGSSKRNGEVAVLESAANAVVLRTSWVFSASGTNFVKTMLELSHSRSEMSIVSDQWGGPTPANAIARACLEIADTLREYPEKSGVYHFSGQPDVSWAEFALEIFRIVGRQVQVNEIRSTNYPTQAERPLNSRLDCTSLHEVFGIARPDWRVALLDVLEELGDIYD